MKTLLQALACGTVLLSGVAYAQAGGAIPRTPEGKPDFQGVWTNSSLTRLERVPEFKDLVLSDAQAHEWETSAAKISAADSAPTDQSKGAPAKGEDPEGYNYFWIDPGTKVGKVKGEYRSSWLTDPPNGKVPYTPAGRSAMMKEVSTYNSFDNPEERIPIERCLIGFASTGGPPMLNALYNNHQQIIQTPDAIAINIEMVHDTRIIRLNDRTHLPASIRPYFGDSVGWYDGDALVIETTNIPKAQAFFGSWENLKVTERLSRTADNRLAYQFTVEDPTIWDKPWSGEYEFGALDGDLYEYACHEGNYAMPGILAGSRVDDAARDTKRPARPARP